MKLSDSFSRVHCDLMMNASLRTTEGNQAEPDRRVTGNYSNRLAKGLTLVEVLVVVSIIAVLVSFVLIAISHSRAKAAGLTCLNNLKQLQACWLMYADNHNDLIPPNRSQLVDGIWRSSPDSWIGWSSAPYDQDAKPIEDGLLFRYDYARTLEIYRCPWDHSKVRTRAGTELSMLRTRSYSMSGCWGGRKTEVQKTVSRLSEAPNPVQTFVFIDEHEDSIDDAHFLTWPYPDDRWVNMPSGRHDQTCTLSFADGHVERWKWKWPKTFRNKQSYWKGVQNDLDRADLQRLQGACFEVTDYRRQP